MTLNIVIMHRCAFVTLVNTTG